MKIAATEKPPELEHTVIDRAGQVHTGDALWRSCCLW